MSLVYDNPTRRAPLRARHAGCYTDPYVCLLPSTSGSAKSVNQRNRAPDSTVCWRKFYTAESRHHVFHPSSDPLELSRVRLVERLWPREQISSALDAGCGDGFLCSQWALRRHLNDIWGVDLVERRVRRAQAAVPQGHFAVQSVFELAFPDRRFDLVSLVETIEHLEQPLEALLEAVRVSRRYVVVTVPYREAIEANQFLCPHCLRRSHPAGHLQSFDEARLSALFEETGLRVIRMRIQCYLKIQTHPLFGWLPKPLVEFSQKWAHRAKLIDGTFLGILGERRD